MNMNVETAKQILKENHYIVESEKSISSKIWGLCEDGIISWEDVAQAALKYMDEDSIEDMNRIYEWVTDDETDEENDDETEDALD